MAQHRHQGHDAGPAGDQEERPAERRLPDEVAADRTAQLDPVADDHDVVEEGRDLAVVDALDRDLDLVGPLRLGRDRVAPLDAVAVLRGQTQVHVLARRDVRSRRARGARTNGPWASRRGSRSRSRVARRWGRPSSSVS